MNNQSIHSFKNTVRGGTLRSLFFQRYQAELGNKQQQHNKLENARYRHHLRKNKLLCQVYQQLAWHVYQRRVK
jgi:hypothetical protein